MVCQYSKSMSESGSYEFLDSSAVRLREIFLEPFTVESSRYDKHTKSRQKQVIKLNMNMTSQKNAIQLVLSYDLQILRKEIVAHNDQVLG